MYGENVIYVGFDVTSGSKEPLGLGWVSAQIRMEYGNAILRVAF